MHARLFFRTRKRTKSFFSIGKTLLLSFFLFTTIGPLLSPVFAQVNLTYDNGDVISDDNDSTYTNYLTLFSPRMGAPRTLSWFDWNRTTAGAPAGGVILTFDGQFTLTDAKNKRWFWDHIAFIQDDPDVFVVKTCPIENGVITPTEQCMLSRVIAKLNPTNCNLLTSVGSGGSTIPGSGGGTIPTTPSPTCTSADYGNALYEYVSEVAANNSTDDDLLSSFSVRIPIGTFHPIAQLTNNDLSSSANPSITLTPANDTKAICGTARGMGVTIQIQMMPH